MAAEEIERAYILTFPDSKFREGFHYRDQFIQDNAGREGWAAKLNLKIIGGTSGTPWGFVKTEQRLDKLSLKIVFRGTVEMSDWLRFNVTVADFANNFVQALLKEETVKINSGLRSVTYANQTFQCHAGFAYAYQAVSTEIKQILGSIAPLSEVENIEIFGHSLGGAMAQLCYCDLKATALEASHGHKTPPPPILLVTLAAPRVFAVDAVPKEFVGADELLSFEVDGDIVPKIPHTGTRVEWMEWFVEGRSSPAPEKYVSLMPLGRRIALWSGALQPFVSRIFRWLLSPLRKADLIRVALSRYPLHLLDFYKAALARGFAPATGPLTASSEVKGVNVRLLRAGAQVVTRKVRISAVGSSKEVDWPITLPALDVAMIPTSGALTAQELRDQNVTVWMDQPGGVASIESMIVGNGGILYSARAEIPEAIILRGPEVVISTWPLDWQQPLIYTGVEMVLFNRFNESRLYMRASGKEIIASSRRAGDTYTSDIKFYAQYDMNRGAFRFVNVGTGLVLAIVDPKYGQAILEREDNLKHNQYWRLRPTGLSTFQIVPFANPQAALAALSQDRGQGGEVKLYSTPGSVLQLWELEFLF